jgi:hypothetical protein
MLYIAITIGPQSVLQAVAGMDSSKIDSFYVKNRYPLNIGKNAKSVPIVTPICNKLHVT